MKIKLRARRRWRDLDLWRRERVDIHTCRLFALDLYPHKWIFFDEKLSPPVFLAPWSELAKREALLQVKKYRQRTLPVDPALSWLRGTSKPPRGLPLASSENRVSNRNNLQTTMQMRSRAAVACPLLKQWMHVSIYYITLQNYRDLPARYFEMMNSSFVKNNNWNSSILINNFSWSWFY